MNAQPYVRHSQTCPKKADRYWKRCKCRKWIWLSDDGKQRRFSAKTRSWERAEQLARKMSSGTSLARDEGRARVDGAVAQYLREKESQNVTRDYVRHLVSLLERQFAPWCQQEALVYLDQVTLAHLEKYRQTWDAKNWGRLYKQAKLKEFFSYCVRHKMLADNPVALLSSINVRTGQTGYFPREEMQRILAACDQMYPRKAYHDLSAEFLTHRLRAFVLLLRWSGLRIGDAISLSRLRLSDDDKLLLYTAKSGSPVFVPLPPEVAAEIRSLPGDYFFWSGSSPGM